MAQSRLYGRLGNCTQSSTHEVWSKAILPIDEFHAAPENYLISVVIITYN